MLKVIILEEERKIPYADLEVICEAVFTRLSEINKEDYISPEILEEYITGGVEYEHLPEVCEAIDAISRIFPDSRNGPKITVTTGGDDPLRIVWGKGIAAAYAYLEEEMIPTRVIDANERPRYIL
jgi:hypothetical protein